MFSISNKRTHKWLFIGALALVILICLSPFFFQLKLNWSRDVLFFLLILLVFLLVYFLQSFTLSIDDTHIRVKRLIKVFHKERVIELKSIASIVFLEWNLRNTYFGMEIMFFKETGRSKETISLNSFEMKDIIEFMKQLKEKKIVVGIDSDSIKAAIRKQIREDSRSL